MQKHLDNIIRRIEEQFSISEKTQWLSNGKHLLKQLQNAIEQKVKEKIVTDSNTARAFIHKAEIANFLDLIEDQKRKALENLISKNKVESLYIDERTLSEFILRNKYPSHQRIRNCLSIFAFDQLGWLEQGRRWAKYLIKARRSLIIFTLPSISPIPVMYWYLKILTVTSLVEGRF